MVAKVEHQLMLFGEIHQMAAPWAKLLSTTAGLLFK